MAESKKLFVVIESGGKYDDAWETTLAGSFDQTKAEKYIVDKELDNKLKESRYEEMNAFSEAWITQNPRPEITIRAKIAIPKWINIKHQDITDDMREERKNIQAQNEQNLYEDTAPMREWNSKRQLATKEWAASKNYNLEEIESYDSRFDDCWYRIQEIDFLE